MTAATSSFPDEFGTAIAPEWRSECLRLSAADVRKCAKEADARSNPFCLFEPLGLSCWRRVNGSVGSADSNCGVPTNALMSTSKAAAASGHNNNDNSYTYNFART